MDKPLSLHIFNESTNTQFIHFQHWRWMNIIILLCVLYTAALSSSLSQIIQRKYTDSRKITILTPPFTDMTYTVQWPLMPYNPVLYTSHPPTHLLYVCDAGSDHNGWTSFSSAPPMLYSLTFCRYFYLKRWLWVLLKFVSTGHILSQSI